MTSFHSVSLLAVVFVLSTAFLSDVVVDAQVVAGLGSPPPATTPTTTTTTDAAAVVVATDPNVVMDFDDDFVDIQIPDANMTDMVNQDDEQFDDDIPDGDGDGDDDRDGDGDEFDPVSMGNVTTSPTPVGTTFPPTTFEPTTLRPTVTPTTFLPTKTFVPTSQPTTFLPTITDPPSNTGTGTDVVEEKPNMELDTTNTMAPSVAAVIAVPGDGADLPDPTVIPSASPTVVPVDAADWTDPIPADVSAGSIATRSFDLLSTTTTTAAAAAVVVGGFMLLC